MILHLLRGCTCCISWKFLHHLSQWTEAAQLRLNDLDPLFPFLNLSHRPVKHNKWGVLGERLERLQLCITVITVVLCHALCLCACATGKSTVAIQIDFHYGRARAQRERQSRTVSSCGHVGEPIAVERQTRHDRLSALTLGFLPEPTVQLWTTYVNPFPLLLKSHCNFFWLFFVFFSGVTLTLTQCNVGVFVCVSFALNEPCVFFGLSLLYVAVFKQDLQPLPESCCSLVWDWQCYERRKKWCVRSFFFSFSTCGI